MTRTMDQVEHGNVHHHSLGRAILVVGSGMAIAALIFAGSTVAGVERSARDSIARSIATFKDNPDADYAARGYDFALEQTGLATTADDFAAPRGHDLSDVTPGALMGPAELVPEQTAEAIPPTSDLGSAVVDASFWPDEEYSAPRGNLARVVSTQYEDDSAAPRGPMD